MKKGLALLLSAGMVVTSIAGLAACKVNTPDTPGPGPGPGPGLSPEGFTRLADPRQADAFEVHSKDGTLVSAHSSIADAINAAVENDLDDFEAVDVAPDARGSYVTKKGSTRKIFENMIKYSAEAAEDNYWYYADNSLVGFEYWTTGAPYARAQNTKNITYQTSGGTTTTVAHSSYGLYDGLGQPISPETYNLASYAWEIIASSDANIKGIPVRESGATGAKYELDLSEVKIKPAYEGVTDEVYAFFGFTIGSGTYSVEIGLACNVNTGEWKQYVSHNPNNNYYAVTVEYDIGDTVFTSTWNKEGGYYSPDVDTVVLEIKEVKDEDELGDEWWYNRLDITVEDREPLTFIVDDEYLGEHGNTGASYDTRNGFFFSAGLDIVAPDAELGDAIKVTDYTNGATFENLIVADAQIWFPSEDEISDEDYGTPIKSEMRGKYHSIREGFSGRGSGAYNYTILALNACIDYELTDGLDTYSFRYDNYEVPASDFTGELKTYQDKIDTLKEITAENAGSFKATLDQIGVWRGPDGDPATGKIPAYCYYVIDWKPYLDALEIYKNAVELTEEGQKLYDDFQTLTAIDSIPAWKGWKAPDGAEATGYLYNELQIFKGLATRYETLPDSDKSGLEQLLGELWDYWMELLEDMTAIESSDFATKNFTINAYDMSANETKTGAQLVDEFFELVYKAYANSKLEHPDHAGALCVELSNAADGTLVRDHFYTTFRLYYLDRLFEKEEISLGYRYALIDMLCDYSTASGAGSYDDFQYLAAVGEQLVRILNKECQYLDEELAYVINTYMVGFSFHNGTWFYAFTAGGGDLNYQGTAWKRYFGDALQDAGKTLRGLLSDVLEPILERDSDAKFVPMTQGGKEYHGAAVDKPVTAIKFELSKEGEAWNLSWSSLNSVNELAHWKGWKSSNADDTDYIYNAIQAAKALIAQYKTLSDLDKAVLAILDVESSFEIWETLEDEYAALENQTEKVTVWNRQFTEQTEMTLAEVFAEFVNGAVWHNVSGCTNPQGYFCMEHKECGANAVYTLYLNKVLEEADPAISYWGTLVNLLKNQGSSNEDYTGRSAGEGNFIDFDYIWNVGKQVGRIIRLGKDAYLDEELAAVVNKYMVANDSKSTSGYGTLNSFYNGTWCWAYYAGTPGYIKGYGINWAKAIDADLATVMGGDSNNWGAAVVYVTDLLTKAGYGNLLVPANGKPATSVPPMVISGPVEALDGPPGLGDVEATVAGVVEAFNSLKLGDLTNVRAWVGGSSNGQEMKGYIYDEVLMFRPVYKVYKTLSANDQAQVKEQAPAFAKWVELSEKYAALEAAEAKYDIVNGNEKSVYDNLVSVNGLAIVNGFFNTAVKTFDSDSENRPSASTNSKAFGYFCMEDSEHFMLTIRALYLYQLISEFDLDFPYAETFLTMIGEYGNGETGADLNSKYTGHTEAQNSILDFAYLWNMSAQIKRIQNGTCTYLDKELVSAINTYMFEDADSTRCYHAFYSLPLTSQFRGNSGALGKEAATAGWERYFGLEKGDGNWYTLITLVNNIILESYGDDVLQHSGKAGDDAMSMNTKVKLEVKEEEGGVEATVAAVVAAFNELGLTDLTAPRAWKGGMTDEGNTKGYVYDEVLMFKPVYLAYNKLSDEDKALVLGQAAAIETWGALYKAYNALSVVKNVKIVNEELTGTATVSELDVVNAYFDNLFASFDGETISASHNNKVQPNPSSGAFGYLCLECEDHFKLSMRALYLNKIIATKGIAFPFAAMALEMVAEYGNGNGYILEDDDPVNDTAYYSKYTGKTEAQNAILDFEYLWAMSAQIKRIQDNNVTDLDAELVAAINEYMFVTGTCAKSFYNLSLSDDFRNNGGKISNVKGWELYFGLPAGDGVWATLINTVNRIITKFYNAADVLEYAAGDFAMLTKMEVEVHEEEKKEPSLAITGAHLAAEGEKVYLKVTGTYEVYTLADLQKRFAYKSFGFYGGGWYYPQIKIEAAGGLFTVSADLMDVVDRNGAAYELQNNIGYTTCENNSGTGDLKTAITGEAVTLNGRVYALTHDGYGNVTLTITVEGSATITGAGLVLEGSDVLLKVTGAYEGYTLAQLQEKYKDFDLCFNSSPWTNQNLAATITAEDGKFTITVNVTALVAHGYTVIENKTGYGDIKIANLPINGETVTANGKVYTLNLGWQDALTLTVAEA